MIATIQRPLLSCNWNIFQTQDEFCQIHHFRQLLHFVRNAFCNHTQVFAIRLLGNERFCHTRSRGKSSLLCEPVNLIRIGANDVTNSGFGYFDVAVKTWYRQGLHGFNLSWIEFLRCHLTLNLSFQGQVFLSVFLVFQGVPVFQVWLLAQQVIGLLFLLHEHFLPLI